MDNLISQIEKKNFPQAVKIVEANTDLFKSLSSSKKDHLLQTLDYNTYTFVIQGLLEEPKLSPETAFLFNKFLREFDYEQVKLRFKQFCDLCKKYVALFIEEKIGIKIVKGLQIALNKIIAIDDGLNPLHTLFVKLCLQTKTYKQATPFLQRAITSFNKLGDMGEEEITNFFYYSGHILMALQKFEEAYLSFRFCLQLTNNSYIYSSTLSARKKLILLVLRNPKLSYVPSEKKFKIDEGFISRYLDFSRNIAADEQEVFNIFTKVYMDLIHEDKYLNSTEEFQKYLTENLEVFEEDKTLGLMKEILASFHLRKLKQLKKLYQNYPLSDLAKVLDVKEDQIIPSVTRALAIKAIGRIDVRANAIIFVKAQDPYRLESLNKLYSLTNLLKQVSNEYNKEHEMIIRDRISMPNTIFS